MSIPPVSFAPRFGAYTNFQVCHREGNTIKLGPSATGPNFLYVEADNPKDEMPNPMKFQQNSTGEGPKAGRAILEVQEDGDVMIHRAWAPNTAKGTIATPEKALYRKPTDWDAGHPLRGFVDKLAAAVGDGDAGVSAVITDLVAATKTPTNLPAKPSEDPFPVPSPVPVEAGDDPFSDYTRQAD